MKGEPAFDEAVRFLAGRERSLGEVERHLRKGGYSREETEAAVAELLAAGYLDERRLVEEALREARRRLWGPARLAEHLRERLVVEEMLLIALERLAAEEEELARRALDRYRASRGPVVTAARAAGYLSRRGFSREVVEGLLDTDQA